MTWHRWLLRGVEGGYAVVRTAQDGLAQRHLHAGTRRFALTLDPKPVIPKPADTVLNGN